MSNAIKALKCGMDETDKELVGEYGWHIKEISQDKVWSACCVIDKEKAFKELMDTNKYNYVVDEDGEEAIIPADYNEFLNTYHLDEAYFHDALPTLYKVVFNKDDICGIIYFLRDSDGFESIFLNDGAVTILNGMENEEISELVIKAQKGSTRKRK